MKKLVFIGSDHRGFEYKNRLVEDLRRAGFLIEDLGNSQYDQHDDYPIFAKKVGQAVVENSALGVLLCGSGVGVTVAANKVKGVRAASAYDLDQVHHARASDDINILTIGSQELEYETALKLVIAFLETEFSGEQRHMRRLDEIAKMESEFGS